MGLSNLATACIVFWFFRDRITTRRYFLSGIIAASFIILAGGTVYSNKIAWELDHKLYQDEIIYSDQTRYQKIVLTKFKDDLRLYLNGNLQFSSIDEYRYHESLVHVPMSLSNHRSNILVLGGGDGLVLREVLKYPDVEKIILVDLDKAITDLSSSYPLITKINDNSFKSSKVAIINDDALKFLDSGSELFDVIIIDLPDPNNEGLAKLYSQEFYRLVSRRLAKDGVFVTQATSPYFSNKTFWLIDNTVRSAGFSTAPYHVQVPSFGEWGFVLGAKYQISQPDTMIENIRTRFLDQNTMKTLFVFDKDLMPQSKEILVSTFYDPLILSSYNEDIRRWDPK
jgi:spermidine synthase